MGAARFVRTWYLTQLAALEIALKRPVRAFDCYATILADNPMDTKTLAHKAFLHAETGDHEAAARVFATIVSVRPDDADSWFNLGYLRQRLGDHEVACAAFVRATTINERHDLAWYGHAVSLIALERLHEAIAPLEKNVVLQPMSPHGYMELARVRLRLGDLAACEKTMRQLKAFDPKNTALLEDETGIHVGVERWWHP